MKSKKEYSNYVRPIKEAEMKEWKPAPRSFTTKLFEAFVDSEDEMVEVRIDELPFRKYTKASKLKSTKQDSFASAFYSWKRRRKNYLRRLGFDVLLIRRGEKVALKKKSLRK